MPWTFMCDSRRIYVCNSNPPFLFVQFIFLYLFKKLIFQAKWNLCRFNNLNSTQKVKASEWNEFSSSSSSFFSQLSFGQGLWKSVADLPWMLHIIAVGCCRKVHWYWLPLRHNNLCCFSLIHVVYAPRGKFSTYFVIIMLFIIHLMPVCWLDGKI
jgi:hypothetical protein